jgi:hypothetical protein
MKSCGEREHKRDGVSMYLNKDILPISRSGLNGPRIRNWRICGNLFWIEDTQTFQINKLWLFIPQIQMTFEDCVSRNKKKPSTPAPWPRNVMNGVAAGFPWPETANSVVPPLCWAEPHSLGGTEATPFRTQLE